MIAPMLAITTATAVELFTSGFLLGITSYITLKKGWLDV